MADRNYPEWLHYELMNWSRWCWLGAWPHPLPPSVCGSIEHTYLHERNPENRVEDERRPIPPNTERAIIVDNVWKGLQDRPKKVLRAEYPQRYESGRVELGRVGAARRLGIRLRDYEASLFVATCRVWDAFDEICK